MALSFKSSLKLLWLCRLSTALFPTRSHLVQRWSATTSSSCLHVATPSRPCRAAAHQPFPLHDGVCPSSLRAPALFLFSGNRSLRGTPLCRRWRPHPSPRRCGRGAGQGIVPERAVFAQAPRHRRAHVCQGPQRAHPLVHPPCHPRRCARDAAPERRRCAAGSAPGLSR